MHKLDENPLELTSHMNKHLDMNLVKPSLASGSPEIDTDTPSVEFDFQLGTSLGFIYQGGIILAVSSKATDGSFNGFQIGERVVKMNDYTLGTFAGGAAECVYWFRVLSEQCRIYELRNKERISVAAASKLMANMIYGHKGMTGLSMRMMLAGYDKEGASLYYLDSEGARTSGKTFSVGSGSVYAFGVLDSGYKWDLTDEEAYELGISAIIQIARLDAYSGRYVKGMWVPKKVCSYVFPMSRINQ